MDDIRIILPQTKQNGVRRALSAGRVSVVCLLDSAPGVSLGRALEKGRQLEVGGLFLLDDCAMGPSRRVPEIGRGARHALMVARGGFPRQCV